MINIPNLFTLSNLLVGGICIALLPTLEPLTYLYFYFATVILDFLDGFIAVKLKKTSTLGMHLDALADVISFGMLPTLIVFLHLEKNAYDLASFFSFFILIAVALRLSKFQVKSTKKYFEGVPAPFSAFFFVTFPLWSDYFIQLPFILISIVIIASMSMLLPLQMISLKSMDKKKWFIVSFFSFLAIVMGYLFIIEIVFFFSLPIYILTSIFYYRYIR